GGGGAGVWGVEGGGGAGWVGKRIEGVALVEAGRFVVHGAHDRARVGANRIGVEIEAGLAFGTGHHGTTRGCLLALDRLVKARRRKRDKNAGSASSRRGGGRGAGVDIGARPRRVFLAAGHGVGRPPSAHRLAHTP